MNVIYTDGSTCKNGKSNASGGYGIYIKKSVLSNEEIKINKKCKSESVTIKGETHNFNVTNIRQEGKAILVSMFIFAEHLINGASLTKDNIIEFLNNQKMKDVNELSEKYNDHELQIRDDIDTEIEIVTDSQFYINVITNWMHGWSKKGIMLEKKNPDLTLYMYYYYTYLNQNGVKVKFTHVRSHQKGKRCCHANSNDIADVLATGSANNTNYNFHLN
jgi:ribonuclease HI